MPSFGPHKKQVISTAQHTQNKSRRILVLNIFLYKCIFRVSIFIRSCKCLIIRLNNCQLNKRQVSAEVGVKYELLCPVLWWNYIEPEFPSWDLVSIMLISALFFGIVFAQVWQTYSCKYNAKLHHEMSTWFENFVRKRSILRWFVLVKRVIFLIHIILIQDMAPCFINVGSWLLHMNIFYVIE